MGNAASLSKKGSDIDDLARLTRGELVKIQGRAGPPDASRHFSLWEASARGREGAGVRPLALFSPKTDTWAELSPAAAYILLVVWHGEAPAQPLLPPSAAGLLAALGLFAPADLHFPFAQGGGDFSFRLYNLAAKGCEREARALSVVKCVELEIWLAKQSPEACLFLHSGFYIAQEKIKAGSKLWLPAPEAPLPLPAQLRRFLDDLLGLRAGAAGLDREFLLSLIAAGEQPRAASEPRNERFTLDLGGLSASPGHQADSLSSLRETSRKLAKLREFETDCSNVWAGRLFVSGFRVACDAERLAAEGITHVINCAGDYCPNEHAQRFVYQTFFIKDSKVENIECIFFEAIEFIEKALDEQGRVLVHCMQGVSRSVSVAVAFLIHRLRLPYAQAFETVRQGRGIASPNIGFISQLMHFEKRVLGGLDPHLLPKVFVAGSHQVEDARRVVFRLLADYHFYKGCGPAAGRNSTSSAKSDKRARLKDMMRAPAGRPEPTARKEARLDPRSVFVVCGRAGCFVWVGAQTCQDALALYLLKAEEHVRRLQRFEAAPLPCETVWQGGEPAAFWEIFGLGERPEPDAYAQCAKWGNWFINFEDELHIRSARSHKSRMAYAEHEVIKDKPAMFVFPYHLEPLYVLDLDDLREDCLAVLCDRARGLCHVWQGSLFSCEEAAVQEFIQAVLQGFLEREESVRQVWQQAGEESEDFFDYFR